MKKFIIFFAALAAVLSCSKENPSNYNPVDGTYSVTLSASAPGADTKTTLVDGEGTKFVHWSKGDAIKVLFFPITISHNAAFSGSNGIFGSQFDDAMSASANFTCDSWSWGSKVSEQGISASLNPEGIALYPATVTATSNKPLDKYVNANTELYFVLPSTQNAIKDNIESNLNFSYATIKLSEFENTISNGARTDLTFNNACAMIELTMPSVLDKKVTSISIASNSGVSLTGKGNVKLTSYNNVVASPFGVDVTDGNGVTLDNPGGFEPGAKYYIVVWPGEHKSGLTIDFTAEDGTKATKTTPGVTLSASKVKPYTFNKGLDFIAPVQDFNYIYADGTTGNELRLDISGVIIYNGDPHVFDPNLPETCKNGLCLKIGEYEAAWISPTSNITSNDLASVGINNISGSTGGYTARQNWLNFSYNKGVTFPMYTVVNQLESPSGSSGWYIGTNVEWEYIWENYEKINNLLTGCNGSKLLEYGKEYWTAVSLSKFSSYIVKYADGGGIEYKGVPPTYVKPIRPILAF